jgi:hypothetical protein
VLRPEVEVPDDLDPLVGHLQDPSVIDPESPRWTSEVVPLVGQRGHSHLRLLGDIPPVELGSSSQVGKEEPALRGGQVDVADDAEFDRHPYLGELVDD